MKNPTRAGPFPRGPVAKSIERANGAPSWMNSNGKPVAKAAEIFRSLRRELALAFSFLGNPASSPGPDILCHPQFFHSAMPPKPATAASFTRSRACQLFFLQAHRSFGHALHLNR